jgi:hypothetical protein
MTLRLRLQQTHRHVLRNLQCLLNGPTLRNQTLNLIGGRYVATFFLCLDMQIDQTLHELTPKSDCGNPR